MFLYKILFDIFYSFNPNHAYWNQRRLFSGNLRVCLNIYMENLYKTLSYNRLSFMELNNTVKKLLKHKATSGYITHLNRSTKGYC